MLYIFFVTIAHEIGNVLKSLIVFKNEKKLVRSVLNIFMVLSLKSIWFIETAVLIFLNVSEQLFQICLLMYWLVWFVFSSSIAGYDLPKGFSHHFPVHFFFYLFKTVQLTCHRLLKSFCTFSKLDVNCCRILHCCDHVEGERNRKWIYSCFYDTFKFYL